MADGSEAERSLHAAVASGWIEEQAPEALAETLFLILDRWLADPAMPPPALWNALTTCLHAEGCLDAEADCWRALLSLSGNEPSVLLRLAETERARGNDPVAQDLAGKVPPTHPARATALLLRLEMGGFAPSLFDELTALLDSRAAWGPEHSRLIRALVAMMREDEARDMLARWRDRFPPQGRDALLEQGWLAMHAGDAGSARGLFEALWRLDDPEITAVAGRHDGTVPDYSPEVEAAIQARIDAAFALPEEALPRLDFGTPPPPAGKVVFTGFRHFAMPNDLAALYGRSAEAAGVDFTAYLDDRIVFPGEARASDDDVAEAVATFEAEMARLGPDILILDCAYLPNRRGLTPEGVRALADRLGFTFIAMLRDALPSTMPYVTRWAEACDRLVIYDPGSPILDPALGFAHKVRVGLTPAQHLRAQPWPETRDIGLLFLGASTYGVRNMVFSVLAGVADIPFTALVGSERTRRVPDLDAYGAHLRRARAVLNVAAHGRGEFLITGRVSEAMASGAVVIEQDNPATARAFQPWRHYLPWRDVADIVQLTRFLERNPGQRDRIAAEAAGWLDRCYSSACFWSLVLGD